MRDWLVVSVFVLAGCATALDEDVGPDADLDAVLDCSSAGARCTVGQGACARVGTFLCTSDGGVACDVAAGDPSDELCGTGIDEDCDGEVDEGYGELGEACRAGVGACQRTGRNVCAADGLGLSCDAVPGEPGAAELCGNARDDDCDGSVDEGYDQGAWCDGPDRDLCVEGMKVCTAERTATTCTDDSDDTPDVCNGVDDDCDPSTPDGAGDPRLAKPTPCDGPADPDRCAEGVYTGCSLGALVCSDPGNDTDADVCDGADNDCDPTTPDGADDPALLTSTPCDGADADACLEGFYTGCSAGRLVCDDPAQEHDLDVCDGSDNDCTGSTPDGSGDPALGTPCDGPDDVDACAEGVYSGCSSGQLVCDDPGNDTTWDDVQNCGGCGVVCTNPHGTTSCASGACLPVCDLGWQSCDGNATNGCETTRLGAVCGDALSLGELAGDGPGTAIKRTGFGDRWYRVRVLENDNGVDDLRVRFSVDSPPDTKFQVCAVCEGCGASAKCGNVPGYGGVSTVDLRGEDDWPGVNDAFTVYVSVHYVTGGTTACGAWELSVTGDAGSSTANDCDP